MKGHKLAGQLILIIMVGVIPLALGYPQHPESQELPAIECGDCHSCKAPTTDLRGSLPEILSKIAYGSSDRQT